MKQYEKMNLLLLKILTLFIFTCICITKSSYLYGQTSKPPNVDTGCAPKDIADLLRKKNQPPKKEKTSSLLIVPVISSNPSTGGAFGAASQYSWFSKTTNPIRLSSVSANFLYTTKNQTLISAKNNIYALKNKLFLSGDWRVSFFSEDTYGLGTNSPNSQLPDYVFGVGGYATSQDSLVQPLRYNYIKFHQTGSIEIKPNVFVGLGIHLDYYFSIKDQKLDTATGRFTSHYLYSKNEGFNPDHYTVSGLSANFIFDTRDNMVNAYKGYFVNANFRYNPPFLGSTKNSSVMWLEYRSFHGLSKEKPRNVLAFWGFANIVTSGSLPYLNLPAIGYDQRGRSGRGYTLARYRGQDLVYAESEWRFQISQCTGILGGVLFANATTTTNRDLNVKLFNYIKPGYGAGLRVMIDKKTRTNIGLDLGFGNKTGSFYLNATEVF